MNLKRKEILICLLVVIAAALLFFGINFLKGVNIFKAANYYYATYNNVAGLSVSAPVTLNGYKVGLVRNIEYQYNNPGHVVVEFSVDKHLRLPEGSEAIIASDILGTASIDLKLSNSQEMYAVGDTVPGYVKAGMMDAVSDQLMPAVSAIVPKVDTLLTSLNILVSDPALTTSVRRLDDITAELNSTIASLHGILEDMQPVVRNVNSITQNVDTITGDLSVVTAQLRELPVDSISADLTRTIDNLQRLSDALNNPDGTVGRLTTDPALYDNLNNTVRSLDSLFVDIKKNPKRYINIKLL